MASSSSRRSGTSVTDASVPFVSAGHDHSPALTLAQLGPSQQDAAEAASEGQLSEFERCRKNCARLALETRKTIKDRDDLMNRGNKSTDLIKLNSVSRKKLAALRAEAAKMDSLYQAEKKKVRGFRVRGM